ncbi:MAG: hypothetical protein LHV68_00555 [Elusimicrobia bacterium]|nr:hypothetical protein [Candidatus Liberimonas magnetica]
MNRFLKLNKPSSLVIMVFSLIVLFYMANYLYLSKYFKGIILNIYAPNLNAVIEYFYGNINLAEFLTPKTDGSYSPMYFFNLLGPLYIFGKNWVLMVLTVNTFYLLMLLTFTYLLGKEIMDEKAGLIAAALVSLYQATWLAYRSLSLEFPLIGITAMSVYILYKSKYFESLKLSLLFALSCAWGMWVKDVFGAFIIGPIFYGFYKALVAVRNKRDVQPLLNFLVFATTFYIAIHPYYFSGFLKLNSDTLARPFSKTSAFSRYSSENIKSFIYSFWEVQLGFPFFIVFLAGIYYFIKFTPARMHLGLGQTGPQRGFLTGFSEAMDMKITLFLWVIIPNLIILLISHWKNARYLIPQVSAVAVVSAYLIRRIIDKKLGLFIFIILVSFGIFRYYWITYNDYNLSLDSIVSNVSEAKAICETEDNIRLCFTEEIEKMRLSGINKNRFTVNIVNKNDYFIDLKTFLWFNNIDIALLDLDLNVFSRSHPVEELAKNIFEFLDNSYFLIIDPADKPNLNDLESIRNLYLYDPKSYNTFNWMEYKSVVEKKLTKFRLRKIPSKITQGQAIYLYIKCYN